jgi:[acyl-carrier-protein] S-malonyltransferase
MGGDLLEGHPEARAVFDLADEALGYGLSEKILTGTEEDLKDTAVQQPAIVTVSLAALAVFRRAVPGASPGFAAGLSLGEYSALAAAGAVEPADAIVLVEKRGRYMAEAAGTCQGAMASVIGLTADDCEAACTEASGAGRVSVANYNSPLQSVVSGDAAAVEKASEICKARGAKKVVRLGVSGAFHTELMAPAAEKLAEALEGVRIGSPGFPVLQNVTGAVETDPGRIRENLVRQLTSPVRWTSTMAAMAAGGVTAAYELGPGKVLAGLFKRTEKSVRVTSLLGAESFRKLDGGEGEGPDG